MKVQHNGRSEKARRRRAVIRRDGERCAFCGSTENLTLDHIVPKSHGGADAIVNLQLLCQSCNCEKANRVDPELVTAKRLCSALPRLLYKAPGSAGSRHLPGCDSVYCMFGCPVFHGVVPGERHPERVW